MKTIKYIVLFTLLAHSAITSAASVNWEGWNFEYTATENSSGLVLKDVSFNNKKLLGKASMPVMRVQYDNDVCGPYADILSSGALRLATQGAPNSACNNQSLCERTFTRDGEKILEIGSNWQIGEYQIYQTYYFSEQGYFDARVYSRGLQCQINHSHHAHWMLDFDIDGYENDRIVMPDGSVADIEFNDQKSNTAEWKIEDAVTGSSATLTPSADDGQPGDFAQWDFAARAYRSSEVGRWYLGARGEIGENYMNGENINSADSVIWYVSHLPHTASEGADLWHASGPRIDTNSEPLPEPPPPQEPPTPAAENLLANGDFSQAKAGWIDCGSASNTAAFNGGMQVSNGGCLYQEAPAGAGENYKLDCDASREGNGWTIMELGFMDAQYNSLASHVNQIRSGAAVSTYSETAVAPENTSYVLTVLYSEDETVFDNCLLRKTTENPPSTEPPTATGDNLLSNGGFENNLSNWSSCAATSLVQVTANSSAGEKAINITGGGCLYQEFEVLSGQSYQLACDAKRSGTQYTSVTLAMLDDQYASLTANELPVTDSTYTGYSTSLVAPQQSQLGTVVVYSEDPAEFDNCAVVIN